MENAFWINTLFVPKSCPKVMNAFKFDAGGTWQMVDSDSLSRSIYSFIIKIF